MTTLDLVVLESGSACTLYGLVNKEGSCESENFLASLPTLPQTQFQARFERLTTVGHLRSPDEMRCYQDGGKPPIWEIKVRSGYRLFCTPRGRDFVATHGAKKPKPRKLPGEIRRAREDLEDMEVDRHG